MIELVVEYTEVIEDSEESDEEGMESNDNNNSGTFTLHALTGYSNPQTMCLWYQWRLWLIGAILVISCILVLQNSFHF